MSSHAFRHGIFIALLVLLTGPLSAGYPFSYGGVNDTDATAGLSIDTNSDDIEDMTTDPLTNDLIVAGDFVGAEIDFSPHNSALNVVRSSNLLSGTYYDSSYIAKYDGVSGELLWVLTTDSDLGGSEKIGAVTTDAAGNIYAVGRFMGTTTITDGQGATTAIQTTDDAASSGDTSTDILILKLQPNGALVWAKRVGSPDGSDDGETIAVDGSGNSYIGGAFKYTADFDPATAANPGVLDPGDTNNSVYTRETGGGEDADAEDGFIMSLNTNGDFRWAKRIGGDDDDSVNSMAVFSTFLYIGGDLESDGSGIHMDDDDTDTEFDSTGPAGATDGSYTESGDDFSFVQKLNLANGNVVWSSVFLDTGTDSSASDISELSVAADGSVYVVGTFDNDIDVNPDLSSQVTISSHGGDDDDDVMVIKLDSNGNYIWATAIGSSAGGDSGDAVYVSNEVSPSVYVSGDFTVSMDADGSGTGGAGSASTVINATGNQDAFIVKLDANGDLDWALNVGGAQYDTGDAITEDGSGNIYIGGQFRQATDIDPSAATVNVQTQDFINHGDLSGRDAFIVKLASEDGGLVESPAVVVHPVPGLTFWGIAGLTALLGLFASRRRLS